MAGLLLASHLNIDINWRIFVWAAIFLVFKAYIFKGSVTSYLEAGVGIYMLILLLGFSSVITWLPIIFMGTKGIASLF